MYKIDSPGEDRVPVNPVSAPAEQALLPGAGRKPGADRCQEGP